MVKKIKKEKKTKTTIEKLRFWKRVQYGLVAGELSMPLIPFGVILGINWSDWVGDSPSEGWSIGMGFGMLIVAVILAIVGIWKKEELVNSKFSGIFYVAILFLVIGFGFKLIASTFNSFGDMLLYVCIGIAGSGGLAQFNKSYVTPEVERYAELVEKNGLDKKSAQHLEEEKQAQKEGESARKADLL